MLLRYGLPAIFIAGIIFGLVTNGLPGVVAALLIEISGGVVFLVMYYGTREQHHDESVSDQPHA
jgi:hypothetical protein